MNSTFLIGLLLLNGGLGSLHAARVSYGVFGRDHQFVLSDGVTRVLTTSGDPASKVIVGYLTTAGDASTFQTFGESPISHPIPPALIGGFLRTATGDNTAGIGGISELADKRIVLWAFGQNGEQGMFTSADWTVPSNFANTADNAYMLLLGRAAPGAPPPAVTTIPLPGFNAASYAAPFGISLTGESPNLNGSSYILGSPIPEPSVVGLSAFMAAWAFRRRRIGAAGAHLAK